MNSDERRHGLEAESGDEADQTELQPLQNDDGEPRRTSPDLSPNGKPTAGGGRETDPEAAKDKKTFHDIIQSFAGDTSLLGVPRVILATSRLNRLFWVVLCVTCAAMFIEGIAELFERYFDYPKQVTVEMKSESVPFPAVTLCNYRSLDFHIINRISRQYYYGYQSPDGALSNFYMLPGVSEQNEDKFMTEYLMYVAKLNLVLESDQYFSDPQVPLAVQVASTRLALYTSFHDEKVYFDAGIPLEQYVASCSLGGFPCNLTRDFSTMYHPSYMKCYTYREPTTAGKQTDNTDEENQPWLMPGLDNGLSMVVLTGSGMVEQSSGEAEALPGLYDAGSPTAGSDGVRVIVHQPDVMPIPLAEGFDVPPGFTASFSVRPRRNVRIGPPHGDCIDQNPLLPPDMRSEAYRQMLCQQVCLQRQVRADCKCYDESLPIVEQEKDIPTCRSLKHFPPECSQYVDDVEPCLEALMVVNQRVMCARQVRDRVRGNRAEMTRCQCRAPCKELIYDVAYSMARWPASGYAGDAAYHDIFHVHRFMERFGDSETILRHFNESGDRTRALKDFARINVYVADPEVLVTRESPEYEPSQLVSDIGGQLGVWIGVSLITVAEVFEFVYFLISRYISVRCSARRRRSHDDQVSTWP